MRKLFVVIVGVIGLPAITVAYMAAIPAIESADSTSEAFWRFVDPDRITRQDLNRISEFLWPEEVDSGPPAAANIRSL